jgi:hypothetical protein
MPLEGIAMGTSKIAVDLKARTFEIEVPDELIDPVLLRLEALLQLPYIGEPSPSADSPNDYVADATPSQASTDGSQSGDIGNDGGNSSQPRRKRGKGTAKVRSYELVDLGLSGEQRSEVRAFYSAKEPAGQNEQVAVLGVILKKLMNKSVFSPDEIHSALKMVDKPTPKNLVAVFGNMKRDGRAGYTDNNVVINSHTDDYVNYHMGNKVDKKK